MRNLKYKMKVGNIVIFLLILFLAIPMVLYIVGSTLMKMNGEWFGKEKKYYGTAIMEIYANMPKLLPTTGENYFNIGRSYYNVITSKHSYGNGSYTSGALGNKVMLEKAIVNFEKGLELGEDSSYYFQNLSYLINSYMVDGREEEGVRLINEASKSDNENIRDVGILNKIVYLVKSGNAEEGIRLCEENLDKQDYQILYVNLLMNYGKYDDYNKALDKFIKKDMNGNYHYYDEVSTLNYVDYNIAYAYGKRKDRDKSIKGRITKGGEGVPYAEVSLSSESDGRTVYTDKDGYYEVNNLSESIYSAGIKVTAYLLDESYIISSNGKENNRYEKRIDISGGSQYNQDFEIREYMSVGNSENVIYEEGSNLVFDIPKINGTKKVVIDIFEKGSGFSFYSDIKKDEDFKIKMPLVNGAAILKYTNYNGKNQYSEFAEYVGNYNKEKSEWSISFKYLDENGVIIENTIPGEIKYKYKGKELNDGDKLMLDGKVDEAITWYEKEMTEKGDSRELLYPLIKYYGENGLRNTGRRNIEKYNEYYKRLEKLGVESVEENFFKQWSSVTED